MFKLLTILFITTAAFAQFPGLTLPPSGNNQKAAVRQNIGPVQVTIDYSSPAVHGPDGKDRRGQIWGKLVPNGMSNLGFGNGKPGPWRAGANENTVFAVSHPVLVEGKPLPAGRYGLHMIPGKEEWTVIFSKDAGAWGSFWYEEANDALRVQVKPHAHEYREWLTYEFPIRHKTDAVAELQWEELAVPIKIEATDLEEIYISRLRQELSSQAGFSYQGYMTAAQYVLQSGKNLDQGLKWADAAITMPGIGDRNFNTMSTKAQILSKLGREEASKQIIGEALKLPSTNPLQIHTYGRQLLTAKKYNEAFEVFKLNADRNGENWPVHVGLARGYAALGENQKALEHAKKALAQAPDALNKTSLEAMVKTLSEGGTLAQ